MLTCAILVTHITFLRYYIPLLRSALCKRYGATGGNLIPNQIASQELRLNVGQLLRGLQAKSKQEADVLRGDMLKLHAAEAASAAGGGALSAAAAAAAAAESASRGNAHGGRRNLQEILRGSGGGGGGGGEAADDLWWDHSSGSAGNPDGASAEDDVGKSGFAPKTAKAMEAAAKASKQYRNPFDVDRQGLLRQLQQMRANFMLSTSGTAVGKQALESEDARHSIPIAAMGDYHEAMTRKAKDVPKNPFAEPDNQSKFNFGNPYSKQKRMSIDETEEAMPMPIGQGGPGGGGGGGMQSAPMSSSNSSNSNSTGGATGGGGGGSLKRKHTDSSSSSAVSSPASSSSSLPPSSPSNAASAGSAQQAPSPSGGAMPGAVSSGTSGSASPTHSETSVDSGIGGVGNGGRDTRRRGASPAGSDVSSSSSSSGGGGGGGSTPQNVAAIKAQCFKEIRQPGRKYEKLLAMVGNVEVPADKQKLVKDLIAECKRYRKAELIGKLEAL